MFWKYIEKINWEKHFVNIFLLKNKRLYISIVYKGYFWECGLKFSNDNYFVSYGWDLKFTVFGIWFFVQFKDKRFYNETEGRFYLEDEPTWLDLGEENYLEWIKSFMQKHPELKEGYYERAVKAMQDNQHLFSKEEGPKIEKERRQQKRAEQYNRKTVKELLTKLPNSFDVNKVCKGVWPALMELPWWQRLKKDFHVSKTSLNISLGLDGIYPAKWDGTYMIFDSFCSSSFAQPVWQLLPDLISTYDLYDKNGNLLSKASDYKTHTKYKRISNTCAVGTHWYLYDKNGNLLYKGRYL